MNTLAKYNENEAPQPGRRQSSRRSTPSKTGRSVAADGKERSFAGGSLAATILILGSTLSGCTSQVDGFDVSARSIFENPDYSEGDSLFMIGFTPVLAQVDGELPGLPDAALRQSVAEGMKSAPPIVCCAGADRNFTAPAALTVVRAAATENAQASDGFPYHVQWRFSTRAPIDSRDSPSITAFASLYHGRDLLTQATGSLELPAADTSTVPPAAVAALVRTVEDRLAFFPSSLEVPPAGGG